MGNSPSCTSKRKFVRNKDFSESMAISEIASIEEKKIHGQWVKVKMVSPASCMHPLNVQGPVNGPTDIHHRSLVEAQLTS